MFIPKSISGLLHFLFPSLIFRFQGQEKKLFLTFDDGPTPGVTEYVLKCLEEYNAKATFFCTGENVKAYSGLYEKIVLSGHQTGNHSWKHLDAFRVRNSNYLRDIERAEEIIRSKIFRPPYGRLWPWQILRLGRNYKIVLWEILIPDYKSNLDSEKLKAKLFPKISEGSIIVMHDSAKSYNHLQYILPPLLEEFSKKGFKFESIQ